MQKRVYKLGSVCRDKATGLKGTLTHWMMDMSGDVHYLFQPKGLTDERQPIEALCLNRARILSCPEETVEVPFKILGSKVTDKASGFTGMAIAFIRHLNGCFHVEIQPSGTLPSKKPILAREFDLRGCVGKEVAVLTAAEKKASVQKNPSPMPRPTIKARF